jgi:hypothetical protein
MLDMALLFEDAQLGANRGVAGWIGKRLVDFGGAGPAAPIEDVHDLALAAAQDGVPSVLLF